MRRTAGYSWKGIPMSSLSVQIRHTDRISCQEVLLTLLSSALSIAGCAALLIPGFPHIEEPWFFYALCGILLSSLFCALHIAGRGRILVFSVSSIVLLLFFILFGTFRNGLFTLSNDLLVFLTGKTGRIHPYFRTEGSAGVHLVIMLYLTLGSLIAASGAYKKRLFLPAALLIGSSAAAAAGFPSSAWSLPICLAAVLVVLSSPRENTSSRRSSRTGLVFLLLPLLLASAIAAAICAGGAVTAGGRVSAADTAAENILHFLHVLRFELSGKNGMPEGNLPRYAPPDDDGTLMLRLNMSRPEKIYLRGFTGDTYENSVWSGLSSEQNIAFAPLFSALHENGFYGQAMISSAAEAVQETGSEEISLRIRPAGACRRYRYLPYGLSDSSVLDPRYIGDAGMPDSWTDTGTGHESEISCLSGSLPEWYAVSLSLAGTPLSEKPAGGESSQDAAAHYLQLEQAYYEYALQTDRQLSEEAALICGEVFGTEPESRQLGEILNLVQQTLGDGFSYEENPDFCRTDGKAAEEDVLAVFLTSRYGASVHYATAAAVMLRYLGVPARYAEGYLLSAEEAADFSPGEEILLTAGHAHAWAEFYLRGIGWVPFESAPGFIDNDDLSRVLSLAEDAEAGTGSGPLFSQAELRYVSGIHNPMEEPSEKDFPPRWKTEYLQILLPVLAGILVTVLLIIFLRRQEPYHQTMNRIRRARAAGKYARAISLEYSYAAFLLKKGGISGYHGLERMKQLNREARFSSHRFSEKDLREADRYIMEIRRLCRSKWSLRERLYYRWVRRII